MKTEKLIFESVSHAVYDVYVDDDKKTSLGELNKVYQSFAEGDYNWWFEPRCVHGFIMNASDLTQIVEKLNELNKK